MRRTLHVMLVRVVTFLLSFLSSFPETQFMIGVVLQGECEAELPERSVLLHSSSSDTHPWSVSGCSLVSSLTKLMLISVESFMIRHHLRVEVLGKSVRVRHIRISSRESNRVSLEMTLSLTPTLPLL
jgi:hypothetical protein